MITAGGRRVSRMRSSDGSVTPCSCRFNWDAASSTSLGVNGCGLSLFVSRSNKLGRRPGPAQAKPHPLGWSGASQRRDEAVAALPRYQRKPAMVLALLPRPPLAHRVGRDAFQFAVDCRNAFRRLRASLEIFTAADRSRQVSLLIRSPASHHLVLHGIADPLQGGAIQFLLVCEVLLYAFFTLQECGKAKRNRSGCRQNLAQHLVKLQRRLLQRFGRAQAFFRVGDLAPVNLHAQHLTRLHRAFAHSRGHVHRLVRLGNAIEQARHSAAHEAWFSTAHSRTRPVPTATGVVVLDVTCPLIGMKITTETRRSGRKLDRNQDSVPSVSEPALSEAEGW